VKRKKYVRSPQFNSFCILLLSFQLKEKARLVTTPPKEHRVHCEPRGSRTLVTGEAGGAAAAGGDL